MKWLDEMATNTRNENLLCSIGNSVPILCSRGDLNGKETPKDGIYEYVYRTMVLEKTLESPLDCKEMQPVHPKGDLSWVFIGRTDAETEAPILWPPHAKS